MEVCSFVPSQLQPILGLLSQADSSCSCWGSRLDREAKFSFLSRVSGEKGVAKLAPFGPEQNRAASLREAGGGPEVTQAHCSLRTTEGKLKVSTLLTLAAERFHGNFRQKSPQLFVKGLTALDKLLLSDKSKGLYDSTTCEIATVSYFQGLLKTPKEHKKQP